MNAASVFKREADLREKLIRDTHAVLPTLKSKDDDEVLRLLSEVRKAFVVPREVEALRSEVMEVLITSLICRGVYPEETVEANPNSVRSMVDGWGAYWHVYSGVLNCPHCGVDLCDRRLGPPFKLEIGHYDMARDRTSHYTCHCCRENISR